MKWLQRIFKPAGASLIRSTTLSHRLCVAHASSGPLSGNRSGDPDPQPTGPREFYGTIRQIKSSPMKLNLVAKLIRYMPIAAALAQIQFCEKKAASYIEKVLLDTQRKAVQDYEIDPLNFWVAESFVGKGQYQKKISYHGRGMHGIMDMYHAHYFLKLREGKPPKKKKNIEDSWRYGTRRFIQAGPRSIPNSL